MAVSDRATAPGKFCAKLRNTNFIKTLLCQVSVGQAGVWGVSPRNEVTSERINGLFAEKIKCV